MYVELVPCPDCSSPAEILEDYYIGTSQSFSCVHCTNPSCQLFAHNPHFTGSSAEENVRRAVFSWNERYGEANRTSPISPSPVRVAAVHHGAALERVHCAVHGIRAWCSAWLGHQFRH